MTSVPASAPRHPLCILGLGLIGGSLLRAASHSGYRTFGYNRSPGTVHAVRAAGYEASDNLESVLRDAADTDALIVIATPTTTVNTMFEAIADTAPHCAVTDVVSVKGPVAESARRRAPHLRFVGGHPMTGTAHSGWEATKSDLFASAVWAVATDDGADPSTWLRVATLAVSVGAYVVPVAADEHDRAVAAISHLPHLTAAVTAVVGAGGGDMALHLAAGSFRDGTRVAGTAPLLQRAMLEANRLPLLNSLSETIDRLTAARDQLRDTGTVHTVIEDGHRARKRYEAVAASELRPITGVRIGEPGWEANLRAQAEQGRVWNPEGVRDTGR